MSGTSFFVDTNIIIYLLDGNQRVSEILQNKTLYCSFITEIELLSSQKYFPGHELHIKKLLSQMHISNLNQQIKDHTVYLRKKYKLKLPDALIAATSIFINIPLITADKSFAKIKETDVYLFTI